MNTIYTVCNRTSLAHALALAESVALHQPEDQFIIGWVDKAPVPEVLANSKVILVDDLKIRDWNTMSANYFDFELVAACRPWFAKYIFETMPSCGRLTFLAPTVLLLQSAEVILSQNHDIILTPHIVSPLPKSSSLLDRRILNIGMFHSNSWTMKRSAQTLEFLNWWSVRTIDRAKYNLCEGMCMDQLWLNFAPVRIFNWTKINSANWHYGLHAVPNHKLTSANGIYSTGNQPIISIDLTGLLLFDPIWADYASLANKASAFSELLNDYRKSVYRIEKQIDSKARPGYGVVPEISNMRTARNKWAGQLKKATTFIDQFQI